MSTYTITTSKNIDELTAKAGGDTYNINGGTLTIDQDTRYGLNQSTSATLGPITVSSTLGGALEVDARYVRIIPFNSGSGNVPACNTVISQGSASGKLLGVYSALNVAPTAAAAAMPTSGYIKIKQWNSNEYAAGALTGIGASATDVSRVGWIELSADDASTITASRLGYVRFRGEWFSLGTTNGSAGQTFQVPSHGLLQYIAGIFVEKSVGSNTYEFYPSSGVGVTIAHKTDKRAKFCYVTSAGVVYLGNNTSVNAGYTPVSGLKVVIPNIILSCNTTAARTANVLPNATLATRYEFATTGGATIIMDKVLCTWYMNIGQAYSVTLSNMAVNEAIVLSEIATPMTITNFGAGQTAAQTNTGLSLATCYAGGTFTDCVISRATITTSSQYVESITDIANFTFNNHKTVVIAARASAQTNTYLTRALNCTWNNITLIGQKIVMATCFDCSINGVTYIDSTTSPTINTNGENIVSISGGSKNININGPFDFMGLPLAQPYNELVSISQSYDCTIRNIGTKDEPLDLGGTPVYGATWSRSSTTATITSVAHGLAVNSAIYVFISSDVAAITIAAKAVVAAATADTFTFTCLNAGASSGTISYVPSNSAGIVSLASSQRIKIQRCYIKSPRGWSSMDNSCKDIVFDNCQIYGPMAGRITQTMSPLQLSFRGCKLAKGTASSSAIYGTHWADFFESDIPPTVSNLSWTRTTTTATVTMPNHGYSTGQDFIVTVSSNEAAIPLGYKTSLTGLTKDTFTFGCVNAGAASGTLTIEPIYGEISLLMNEPTANTSSQFTIIYGDPPPQFTSTGYIMMPNQGDEVIFEMPYYALGHTGFTQVQPRLFNGTISNYNIYYAIDKNDGNGYSGFKNLNYNRLGGSGTSGQFTFTVTNATGVNIDDYVYGTGIRYGAKVTEKNGNTITVNLSNIATVSGNITFSAISNESGIDPSKGFKLKIKYVTCVSNSTGAGILNINTKCTEESRKYQYILDTNTITFTGLPVGTDAVVLSAGTDTVLDTFDQITGTTYTYTYSGAQNIDIGFIKQGYVPFYIRNLALTTTDSSIPVSLTTDRNFSP